MRRECAKLSCVFVVLISFVFMPLSSLFADRTIPLKVSGVFGEYSPETGDYSNPGVGTPTGRVGNEGTVLLTPTNNPLVLEWVTDGFHVLTDDDGDQIFMSGGGSVELIPTGNMDGKNTEFTAEWGADFHIEGGNGKYEGIRPGNKPIAVSAVNDPFFLDENFQPLAGDIWTFSSDLEGTFKTRNEFFDGARKWKVKSGDGIVEAFPLPAGLPESFMFYGVGAPLGKYECPGEAVIDGVIGQIPTLTGADFSGTATFESRDGSILACTYDGIARLIPTDPKNPLLIKTRWEAEFKPIPTLCTGRFANVSDGSLMMTALTDPIEINAEDIPVSWSGSGYLQYDR